jgi:hypothetical protein
MNKIPLRILYGRRDAAEALGISIRSLDYLIASGQLPTRCIGSRRLLTRSAIERYARSDHPNLKQPRKPRKSAAPSSSSDDK